MTLPITYIPGGDGWLRGRYEFIATAVNRDNMTRFLGIIFQLLPQLRDMYVHRAGVADGLIAPHLIQQFFPGNRRLPMGDQVAQELELPSGELDWLTFARHFLTAKIDRQIFETEYGIGQLPCRLSAAQQRFNTR